MAIYTYYYKTCHRCGGLKYNLSPSQNLVPWVKCDTCKGEGAIFHVEKEEVKK